jgi:hypothetical protein
LAPAKIAQLIKGGSSGWIQESTKSFQEEYRELLKRHGVEFDERYVWG